MAEPITLEQVMRSIGDLGSIIQAGFAYAEKRFDAMEIRVENIEKDLKGVKDRLSGIEYGVRQMQKDFVSMDEEIRGIHKVIDSLNIRIVALERNFGAPPLFPAA